MSIFIFDYSIFVFAISIFVFDYSIFTLAYSIFEKKQVKGVKDGEPLYFTFFFTITL